MKVVVALLLLMAVGVPHLILYPPSLAVPSAHNEDGESDRSLPTAEKVLDRAMLAAGGYEVIGSESSTHWISKGSSSQGAEFVYEYYQAKGKFFSKFTYEDGRIIERGVISDGTLTKDGKRAGFAWEIVNGGSVREMKGDELQEYLRRRTKIKKSEAKENRFKSAKCVAIESVRGEDAYKLVLVDHDGTELEKFYSVKTGLCIRRVCNEEFGGSLKLVTRDYFDYRQVGERMVSHFQTVSYNYEIWEYRTSLFESNIDIPEGTFDVPKAIEARPK